MPTDPAPMEDASREPRDPFRRGEILLAAALSAMLLTAFLVLPIVGALALPFAAVPVVRLTHRGGPGAGLLGSALCAGVLLALGFARGQAGETVAGVLFVASATVLPALFARSVFRPFEPSSAYLALCLAGFALIAGALWLRAAAGGPTMRQEIGNAFDEMVPVAVQSYSRANMDSESTARMKTTLAAARDFTRKFWAGLVGASWVLGSAISFYAGASAARPGPSADVTRFEELRIPAPVAALFVASGACSVLLPSPGREVAGNVLLPLAALYFVAGLSIICHFARKWFRVRILRIGLYSLVVYFPINVGVGLLGLFDWYADFRRRGEGVIQKP